jgi:hypothetical protein
MKNLFAGLIISACSLQAFAVPINFEFSGGSLDTSGSSVVLSSYTANSGSAMLDDGEWANFTFGSASVVGFGNGDLELTVDFTSPIFGSESVNGAYSVASIFIFSAGEWEGGYTDFDYLSNGYAGTARLSFDAIDTGLQLGPHFEFNGTIKNLGSTAVPEPGSMALLALGLIGLGVSRRKQA